MIDNLTFGGAERLVTDLLPLFKELGFEADLLVLKKMDSQFAGELKSKGVEVYDTGLNNEYSLRQIFRLASFFKKNSARYCLIHAHLFPAQYWLVLAKLLSGKAIPLVTTEHNTFNRRRGRLIFKLPERFIYSRYNRVICISEPAQANLIKWLPSLQAKTVVIPNGINLERFYQAAGYPAHLLSDNIGDDDRIILMIASLSRQKDQATVIRAAAKLPEKWQVVFVGDGPQKESLQKLADSLNVSGRVHFLGMRSDVERIIKSAHIFVISSHWEGFGLVAIEAMAGSLPVIASNVSGLADIVEGAGMLFPPGDELKLADCIEKVLTSESLYRELVNAGSERAEEYSMKKTAASYAEVYQQVLNNGQLM